ncbi:cell division protein FtsQ/DivIB [Thermodesulfobacteriota bacterium]
MKRKPVLYRQSVKRKRPMNYSEALRVVRLLTSFSLKIICLFIGVVSISILFLYLYQYLVSTPYIKLREVSIEGVDDGLKRELIELADLDSELSLLTLNLDEMKKKMESHPWVRTVELEKSFPHLLRIKAEREKPLAIVALDRLFYMNRWGVAFKEIDYSDNKDYPVITGISEQDHNREDYMEIAAGILTIFENDMGVWSINNISELHFNNIDKVSLYSTELPVVLKMGSSKLALKKKKLGEIIALLKRSGRINLVKAIDLNYEDMAVVSYKKAG